MVKITPLTDLANLQNETTAVNAINNNNQSIETAFDNTLSRDGSTPNQMNASIDMNSERIVNLPAPIGLTEPVRLEDLVEFEGGGTIEPVPPGGLTGQALVKASDTSYDVDWEFISVDAWVTPEQFGAVGDGVTDDAPAFRDAVAALDLLGGGELRMSPKTYLMGSTYGGTSVFIRPCNNLSVVGSGDKTILKAADGLNTVSTQYFFFYPTDTTIAGKYINAKFQNFKLDFNGANNTGFDYNNIGIGGQFVENVLVDNVTFSTNPGSQNITFGSNTGLTASNIRISNTTHINCGDVINSSCLDHSSIHVIANYALIQGNVMYNNLAQSQKSSALELHGLNVSAIGNSDALYHRAVNIASQTGHAASNIIYQGNTSISSMTGIVLWNDGTSFVGNIVIDGNTFRQAATPVHPTQPYHDFDFQLSSAGSSNVIYSNNTFESDIAAGTANASLVPVIQIGRITGLKITGNTFKNASGPAIYSGTPGAVTAATSYQITDNLIVDCGRSSTAGARRGILINQGTTINSIVIANNRIINVASTYMTTGIDVTQNATYGSIPNDNFISNVATPVSLSGTGYTTGAVNTIPVSAGIGVPYSSITTANSSVLSTNGSGVPSLSTTLPSSLTIPAPSISTINLTGGQITFPAAQSASGGANVLDDYEEGSFSPTISFGGASVGVTYTVNQGQYTKIGNLVRIGIAIVLSSKGSSTGNLSINGLPFAHSAFLTTLSPFIDAVTSGVGDTMIVAKLGGGASNVELYKMATGVATILTNSDITNNTSIYINGSYQV